MKTILLILITIIPLLSQEVHLESKSSYHFEKNDKGTFFTTTNSNYHIASNCVIHEKITDRFQSGADGSYGRLEAKAYEIDNKKIKWEISDFAHKTFFIDDFYAAVGVGCCGGENTVAYFNLENGKKIFSSTSKLLKVQFSNENHFYISLLSISGTKDYPPQYNYNSKNWLILTLSSSTEVLSRMVINSKSELGDYEHTPDEIYFLNSKAPEYLSIKRPYFDKNSINDIYFEFDYWGPKIRVQIKDGIFHIIDAQKFTNFTFTILTGNEKDAYLFNQNFTNISYKSNEELRLLRNEIFARNGHSFHSTDLKQYFNSTSWYIEKSGHKVSSDELSNNEKVVLKIISEFEKGK